MDLFVYISDVLKSQITCPKLIWSSSLQICALSFVLPISVTLPPPQIHLQFSWHLSNLVLSLWIPPSTLTLSSILFTSNLFFFFFAIDQVWWFYCCPKSLMTPSSLKVNTSTPQQGRQILDNMALTYFAPSSSLHLNIELRKFLPRTSLFLFEILPSPIPLPDVSSEFLLKFHLKHLLSSEALRWKWVHSALLLTYHHSTNHIAWLTTDCPIAWRFELSEDITST